MLKVIRNYRTARKHADLRDLAQDYLVASLKAEAVVLLLLPMRLPLALVGLAFELLERLFWNLDRLVDRVLDADWWPGWKLVDERDRLSEKLWRAYAPYRKEKRRG